MGRTSTNLIGKRFGLLTVIATVDKDKWGHAQWQCSCRCGGEKVVKSGDLGKRIKSCGCLNHLSGEQSGSWKGGKVEVRCANPLCGKAIKKYNSKIKNYTLSYCSNECRYAHRPETIKGENNPRYKEKVKVACAFCDKPLEISQCYADTYHNHFCKGTDCVARWKEINQKGNLNPNWKGGISYDPYPPIFVDKRFKAGIRERDNHECQNPGCPKTTSVLAIHHIDYNKKNCEPENLITLCNVCNSLANANRDFWQAGYEAIIRSKYKAEAITL